MLFVTKNLGSRDICVKNGILREVSKIRVLQTKPVDVSLDIGSLQGYLKQISDDAPNFIKGLTAFSNQEELDKIKEKSSDLKYFNGKFNVKHLQGKWIDATEVCDAVEGEVLNLDYPTNKAAAVKFLTTNDINRVPLGAEADPPYLFNKEGKVLAKITNADNDLANRSVFASFKKDGSITIEAAPAENTDILCLTNIRPIQPFKDRPNYTYTWKRVAVKIIDLVGQFKKGYELFKQNLNSLPLVNIHGLNRIIGTPKFPLIKLAKFFSLHQYLESFANSQFNDLDQLNEMVSVFKNLVKAFKPTKNIFTLPLDLVDIEGGSYSSLSVNGKQEESGRIILAAKTTNITEENSSFITQFRFIPYQNNAESFKPGYIIAKTDEENRPGNDVFFTSEYRPIGSGCKEKGDEMLCEKYSPGFIPSKQIECAKNILSENIIKNNCELVESVPSGTRTDCIQGKYSIVKLSTPFKITIDIKCNDRYMTSYSFDAGIHQLETNCGIFYENGMLVPQVFSTVSSGIDLGQSIKQSDSKGESWDINTILKYAVPTSSIFVLALFVCCGVICYLAKPEECIKFVCCCRKKVMEAHSMGNMSRFDHGSTRSFDSAYKRAPREDATEVVTRL